MILGITGGIGCGKSTILSILEEKYNFYIIEADKIGHDLMKKGELCYEKIVKTFGNGILCDNTGEIDRKKLADIVFKFEDDIKIMNQIIHPAAIEKIKQIISRERDKNGISNFVVESALLIDSGCNKICDKVWYIYTDDDVRIERLKKSRGMSENQIRNVMKNQMSRGEFTDYTDALIDNSKNIEITEKQINKLLEF